MPVTELLLSRSTSAGAMYCLSLLSLANHVSHYNNQYNNYQIYQQNYQYQCISGALTYSGLISQTINQYLQLHLFLVKNVK